MPEFWQPLASSPPPWQPPLSPCLLGEPAPRPRRTQTCRVQRLHPCTCAHGKAHTCVRAGSAAADDGTHTGRGRTLPTVPRLTRGGVRLGDTTRHADGAARLRPPPPPRPIGPPVRTQRRPAAVHGARAGRPELPRAARPAGAAGSAPRGARRCANTNPAASEHVRARARLVCVRARAAPRSRCAPRPPRRESCGWRRRHQQRQERAPGAPDHGLKKKKGGRVFLFFPKKIPTNW